MAITFTSIQLERLRRDAKRLARENSLPHGEALDRIAAQHGFGNWSQLANHSGVGASRRRLHSKPVAAAKDGGKRYYLHGDIHETDPSRCYCARCDQFVDKSHFKTNQQHNDGKDGERYLTSLARWRALPMSRNAVMCRPDNAPNVLARDAIEERAAYQASRSSFHLWLESQRERDDPVGDLAGDILRDRHFPVGAMTRPDVQTYLVRRGAGAEVLSALRHAWREFSVLTPG